MPAAHAWHRRFVQQAGWTAEIRRYLTADLPINSQAQVLEVGCGTGALFPAITDNLPIRRVFGLDIDRGFLELARRQAAELCQGDALALPFPAGTFDLVYCHFFLLWVADPSRALAEMRRVARPGAAILAFAEPDYGGRIDYPMELEPLGALQKQSLASQGADPLLGRKLGRLFTSSGLQDVQVGVLGGLWSLPEDMFVEETENWVLEQDLAGILGAEELERYLQLDRRARRSGQRTLFIPTFYARGWTPKGS